jgi:hypothetical protein
MANSDFQRIVSVGGRNGGNAHLANVVDSDRLPWALAPELAFSHTVKWTDIAASTDVAQSDELTVGGTIGAGDYIVSITDARTGNLVDDVTYVVHEDTVTIGGTASDGNYDIIFATLDPPVRARVTRTGGSPATNANIATSLAAEITDLIATSLAGIVASASANAEDVEIVYEAGIAAQSLDVAETTATGTLTVSTSETDETVAAGLEALLQTARATTLADYLEGESVAAAVISLDYVDGVQVLLEVDFPVGATGTNVIANVATIPMGRTGDWFPSDVVVDGAMASVGTAFVGLTTLDLTIGDVGAANGLLTASDCTATGALQTTAAAEHTDHFEATFQPLMTLTADGLFTDVTAGEVTGMVFYTPPPTI